MKSVIHGLVLPREIQENQPMEKFEHRYYERDGSNTRPGIVGTRTLRAFIKEKLRKTVVI